MNYTVPRFRWFYHILNALSAGHNISITSTDSAELSSVANMQLYMNTPPETVCFISPPN